MTKRGSYQYLSIPERQWAETGTQEVFHEEHEEKLLCRQLGAGSPERVWSLLL